MTTPAAGGSIAWDSVSPETATCQMMSSTREQQYDSISPAIYPSTTYERDADLSYPKGKCYSRDDNPTCEPAETVLCQLEGGGQALLFSSGMAAAVAVFQSLRPGDTIIIPEVMYWGLRNWVKQYGEAFGINVVLIEMKGSKTDDLERALAGARGGSCLVWVETPANPTWDVVDLEAVAAVAHASGACMCVDGTAATPVLTRPLAFGANIVMHSATKYLNGHSDVVAGALVCSVGFVDQDMWQKIRFGRRSGGSTLGAMDAWLLQRGMRTLFLRVRRQCSSALEIATSLDSVDGVDVLYPGLESHPQHDVAKRQMEGGFGGMLSLRIHGGRQAAIDFASRLKVIKLATSLGGVESLAEHRASIEGQGSPVPDDLIRLSVGIEDPKDLIRDLLRALGGSGSK